MAQGPTEQLADDIAALIRAGRGFTWRNDPERDMRTCDMAARRLGHLETDMVHLTLLTDLVRERLAEHAC